MFLVAQRKQAMKSWAGGMGMRLCIRQQSILMMQAHITILSVEVVELVHRISVNCQIAVKLYRVSN